MPFRPTLCTGLSPPRLPDGSIHTRAPVIPSARLSIETLLGLPPPPGESVQYLPVIGTPTTRWPAIPPTPASQATHSIRPPTRSTPRTPAVIVTPPLPAILLGPPSPAAPFDPTPPTTLMAPPLPAVPTGPPSPAAPLDPTPPATNQTIGRSAPGMTAALMAPIPMGAASPRPTSRPLLAGGSHGIVL